MIRFVLLLSRQGKVRLAKWYTTLSQKERAKIIKEVSAIVLPRAPKLCNFIDWRDAKLVYRRYASLYFVCGIDQGRYNYHWKTIDGLLCAEDNELITLDILHQYVETLDRYFGNVCELDLIFNFHKAYFILDELLVGGEMAEPSKRVVSRVVEAQDVLVEEAKLAGPEARNVPMITGPRG